MATLPLWSRSALIWFILASHHATVSCMALLTNQISKSMALVTEPTAVITYTHNDGQAELSWVARLST